jgi:hypothetical protein
MIHVCVRQQQHIDWGQLGEAQGRGYKPFWTCYSQPERDSDSVSECGIGQDSYPIKVDQNGGMSKPTDGDVLVGPLLRSGPNRGGRHLPLRVGEHLPKPTGAAAFGKSQPRGTTRDGCADGAQRIPEKHAASHWIRSWNRLIRPARRFRFCHK